LQPGGRASIVAPLRTAGRRSGTLFAFLLGRTTDGMIGMHPLRRVSVRESLMRHSADVRGRAVCYEILRECPLIGRLLLRGW